MNRIYFTLFVFVWTSLGVAHSGTDSKSDTLYYKSENGFIGECGKDKATGFRLRTPSYSNIHLCKVYYLISGQQMAEFEAYDTLFYNKQNNVQAIVTVRNGRYEQWYISGEKCITCTYKRDKLNGDFNVYYKNGALKRSEKWENGKWISGDCFDENGNKTDYCLYSEMAEFVGGLPALYQYFGETLRYPNEANLKRIEGVVRVTFVIDTEGNITNVALDKPVDKYLDAEALRIVWSMPKWKPGKLEGKPVPTEFTLPIRFRLPR